MNRYIEIQLLPDPEFTSPLLMGALFSKLHRGLVALGSGTVGVSFPDFDLENRPSLGERLRLHGEEAQLTQLMMKNWLTGMQDHTKSVGMAEVPVGARHRTFYRVQAKSNPERLRRRRMKRLGEDDETARLSIPDYAAERLALPYMTMSSQSTGHRFPLFVNAGSILDEPTTGAFNTYGLSRVATIPWF